MQPYQDTERIFIDDVIQELLCLLHQRPASEKRGVNLPALPPQSSNDILYTLEALECWLLPLAFQDTLKLTHESDPKSSRSQEFAMPPAPLVSLVCVDVAGV
jgi:ubiquitin carboxyl-terminal hydrolase 25/28